MIFMLNSRFGPLKTVAIVIFTLAVLAIAIFVPSALAAGEKVPLPDDPIVSAVSLYIVALNLLTPFVGYLINYFLPQTSSQAKVLVQAVLAAAVGILVGAAGGSDFGLNAATLLNALTAMITAAGAHMAYARGDLNGFFGGGKNKSAGDALFQKTPG